MARRLTSTRYVLCLALLLLGYTIDSDGGQTTIVSGEQVEVRVHWAGLFGCLGCLLLVVLLLRDYWIVPRMLLPSIYLSVLPQVDTAMDAMKADFLAKHGEAALSLQLPTSDRVRLDAVVWRNAAAPGRWIVWFNANGFLYESILDFLHRYAVAVGAGFVAFSYRGVSRSDHTLPVEFADLVCDGQAVVDWLVQSEGAQLRHVLMHGHSLGGAVATAVRLSRDASGPLVNDRSFASLFAVTRSLFFEHNPAFAAFVAYVLGCFLAVLLVFTFDLSLLAALLFVPLVVYLFARLARAHPPLLHRCVRLFFTVIGWHVDVAADWSASPLHASAAAMLVHHPDDHVIASSAALVRHLRSAANSVFRLPATAADPHNTLLDSFDHATWLSLTQSVRRLFPD